MIFPANKIKLQVSQHFKTSDIFNQELLSTVFQRPVLCSCILIIVEVYLVAIRGNGTTMMTVGCT